ncbi:MAG: triose-phosphate isomerase [Rectinemataceae bacterium]
MKRYFIAGNWKMYKTIGEAVSLAADLRVKLAGCGEKLMVAPPFTALNPSPARRRPTATP